MGSVGQAKLMNGKRPKLETPKGHFYVTRFICTIEIVDY